MNLRVFEYSWSLPLLIVLLVMLSIILHIFVKREIVRFFIPTIVICFGLLYSVLQIYVLGKGYSGIPFVLVSWLLLILLVVDVLRIIILKIKKQVN
ncbi:hypothetical protein D1B31_01265 [Neobacillus notoginsengisoli]|uniref:Uncharacterized protein n=1 Tax=Neobacillus notoginsengisoli TaxID=1578198 RepID=A0A417YZM4_9BACI|nr:hypothetical protein D1B31_01265 [Neobacillus notoginsengisoli]